MGETGKHPCEGCGINNPEERLTCYSCGSWLQSQEPQSNVAVEVQVNQEFSSPELGAGKSGGEGEEGLTLT